MTYLNAELGRSGWSCCTSWSPRRPSSPLLVNPTDSHAETTVDETCRRRPAPSGCKLHVLHASTERDFDTAFATLAQLRAGGLVIGGDAFFNSRSEQLAALAVRHAVPAIFQFREFAAAGGLMSYGGSITDATVWPASTPAGFSRARSPPTCRSSSPRKSS